MNATTLERPGPPPDCLDQSVDRPTPSERGVWCQDLGRRRCTASLSDGSGTRCKRAPIPGGRVCSKHGGSAPQVRDAARRLLLEAAEPAAAQLARDGLTAPTARERTSANVAVLDRAGCGPRGALELSGGVEVAQGPSIDWGRLSADTLRAVADDLGGVEWMVSTGVAKDEDEARMLLDSL